MGCQNLHDAAFGILIELRQLQPQRGAGIGGGHALTTTADYGDPIPLGQWLIGQGLGQVKGMHNLKTPNDARLLAGSVKDFV
jgi:hypothetical protein